jgi:hypothetical protein
LQKFSYFGDFVCADCGFFLVFVVEGGYAGLEEDLVSFLEPVGCLLDLVSLNFEGLN